MRARVRITDLSAVQWARLQDRLMTSYHITAGAARVCAEFESGHPQDEVRHVEMPVQEFATVMTELNHLGYAAELRAEGEPLPPALHRELLGVSQGSEEVPDDISYEEQYGERP